MDAGRLAALQQEPDSPEALATIPHVCLSDLPRDPAPVPTELREDGNVIIHDLQTDGIVYTTAYFAADDLTPEELRPIALSYLKPKRMPHVLGTEQEAVRLTRRYGGDETQARIAALLHDCTKKLEMPEQLALCKQYGIELDELEQKALKLLHSKTGAAIARSVFGVEDAVYDAIWYHTTGRPDMTRLEKILYLADYIEPSRDFPGVEELRRAVYEDLDHGLLLGLNMTIQEMEEMGNPVHHQTRDARDYLLKRGIR